MFHVEPKVVLSGRGTILTSKFRAIPRNRLKLHQSALNCTLSAMRPTRSPETAQIGTFQPIDDMSSISQVPGFKVAIGHFGRVLGVFS